MYCTDPEGGVCRSRAGAGEACEPGSCAADHFCGGPGSLGVCRPDICALAGAFNVDASW